MKRLARLAFCASLLFGCQPSAKQSPTPPIHKFGSTPIPLGPPSAGIVTSTSLLQPVANSILPPDFSRPTWQAFGGGYSGMPSITPNAALDAEGFRTAANINVKLNASNHLLYVAESPGTGGQLCVEAAWVANATTLSFWVLTLGGATTPGSADLTISGPIKQYCVTISGLTVGTNYYFGWSTIQAGQSAFSMAHPTFAPTGVPSGVLSGNFVRYEPRPELLWGNHLLPNIVASSDVWPAHASHTEFRLHTNATEAEVEYLDAGGGNDHIGFWTNGQPYASITTAGTAKMALADQTLPAGLQELRILVGDNGSQGNPVGLSYWRALYLPAVASADTIPPPDGRRIIYYGDSRTEGSGAAQQWSDSWVELLKARTPGLTFIDAAGSRQLHDDAATSGAQLALAQRLVACRPTDVVFGPIGFNDWNDSTWLASAFGTAYQGVGTDMLTLWPSARYWFVTDTVSTNAGTNGNGETLANFRTQESSAATAIIAAFPSSKITGVDGTTLWTSSQLADVVHPNQAGHGSGAQVLGADMGL